ncbi:MAG: imidazolonepropionase [Nitriliruptorales bacterium]|nr:imidazolonepropionase [Nitriliruptorales bacterium]
MLVDGIGLLATGDPQRGAGPLGTIPDATVVIDGGRVAWVGPSRSLPEAAGEDRLDVGGRCVLPGFVDAHTHLLFGGERAEEFAARLAGHPYTAGGIRDTVAATRAATDDELRRSAGRLATEALRGGTTTLEVKSGYGLTVDDERRLLEVAAGLETPGLPRVHRTFLGAHVVPPEYAGRADDYVTLVCDAMLDACAPLAAWCDVFCEQGAFDTEQSRAVLYAGKEHGLGLRIHANQLGRGPGARLAAELGATSADHLTHLTDDDIAALAGAGVVATLLPAAEFCTGSPPAPARRLLDAGATVALASDCNPGTSYTTSMALVVALACRTLGMTPDEAVHAATAGGAAALGLDDVGRVVPGHHADLLVLNAPSPVHLAYRPGVPLTWAVLRAGAEAWRAP